MDARAATQRETDRSATSRGTTVGTSRGTSNDDVRRHNLSTVLTLIHRNRAISRSQLTRSTGLNRSTIAALVAELSELRLVTESEPDATRQVGRPSPVVRPSVAVVAVTVNPEIDAITVTVVALGGQVIARRRQPIAHPSIAQAVAASATMILDLTAALDSGLRVAGIGLAVPGLVRTHDGVVRLAPHLGWREVPLAALLAEATGLAVRAANDAHLGSLGESTFGAGRGISEVIYLNGGASGIGGGIITGGVSLDGAAGYAGELGHTLVTSNGIPCHCGASGCLETEVRREKLLRIVGLVDGDADQLEAALLASDDPAVLAEVHRQLDFLGIALRNAINMLNPRLIVLGGFLGSLHTVAPDHLDGLIASQPLAASREGVRVTRAELGSDLLAIGAGELAFEALLADPARVATEPEVRGQSGGS